MKTFVLSLTVMFALTLTQPIFAEAAADSKIPKELQGSWIVDQEASIKSVKASPKWKVEDEKKLPMMMKMLSMICFTFHEDKVVSAMGPQKEQADLELLSVKDGTYKIKYAGKHDSGIMTAILAKDGTLNLRVEKSDDMNYMIWKKGTLSATDAKTDIVGEIVEEVLNNGSSKAANKKISVVSGQKIAFLGDSITQAGASPGGYCQLVINGLKKQGIEATPVYAGISGHKSNEMLARLEKDVLSKKPDWMTLSCGVNDVWHGKNGVKLPEYKTNITAIVDKAQAQGIKVMILTSTMIRENQSGSLNQQLLPYNAFLKELAKKKGCLFADLNDDMQQALKKFPKNAPKGKQLTSDGVHMNPLGNYMMAKGILKTFGVSQSKFPALVKEWKKIPGGKSLRFGIGVSLSQYEYEQLQRKYDKPLQRVFQDLMNKAAKKAKEDMLKVQ